MSVISNSVIAVSVISISVISNSLHPDLVMIFVVWMTKSWNGSENSARRRLPQSLATGRWKEGKRRLL